MTTDLRPQIDGLLPLVAARLEALGRPLKERDLEEALLTEFAQADGLSATQQQSVQLDCWEGRVGPADLALGSSAETPALLEVKLGESELAACSWDTVKLAALVAEGKASAGLLVAAAARSTWLRIAPGADLFEARGWDLNGLLSRYGRWFAFWREDVANYPKRLPASWEMQPGGRGSMTVEGEPWEIRVASIESVSAESYPVAYSPHVAAWKRGAPKAGGELELPDQDHDRPEGDLIARYHSREQAEAELGKLERAGRGEGFGAFIRSDHQLILDEGTMRSFAPPGELEGMPLVQALAFSSPTERRLGLARRRLLSSRLHPDALSIGIGGAMGASGLDLEWDGDALRLRRHTGASQPSPQSIRPKPAQWARFWAELDRLDVWDWWPNYQPERFATDGASWHARIYKGGRILDSRGYMAYPEKGGCPEAPGSEWRDFLAATVDLVGSGLVVD